MPYQPDGVTQMKNKNPEEMKIGALANKAGVHVETIRYYQSIGLMPKPERQGGGARRYGEGAIERLRFIRRAQGLGFSLEEVKQLLSLSERDDCGELRRHAEERLVSIRDKLSELRRIETVLVDLVSSCGTRREPERCPIVECLSSEKTACVPQAA
jgi:MerR family mercuric resistance operon transcriptional regulator